MRAMKQTYLGRVIFPAKYIEAKKPFLSFVLYVDNHLVSGSERKSARISCNYTLPDNAGEDEVAVVLSRVFSKDDPDTGGLGGEDYKSVDVLVEGEERLVEVEGKSGAVYKNLDYCRVTIVDKKVKSLFKKEFSKDSGASSGQDEEVEQKIERPNTTPVHAKTQPVVESEVTTTVSTQKKKTTKEASTYEIGQVVEHGSKKYRFTGGPVDSTKSWELVVKEEDSVLPPFMTESKTNNRPRSALREAIEDDSDLSFEENDNPVV